MAIAECDTVRIFASKGTPGKKPTAPSISRSILIAANVDPSIVIRQHVTIVIVPIVRVPNSWDEAMEVPPMNAVVTDPGETVIVADAVPHKGGRARDVAAHKGGGTRDTTAHQRIANNATTHKRLAGNATVHRRVAARSEEHTSELQSPDHLVCRLLLEKKNNRTNVQRHH